MPGFDGELRAVVSHVSESRHGATHCHRKNPLKPGLGTAGVIDLCEVIISAEMKMGPLLLERPLLFCFRLIWILLAVVGAGFAELQLQRHLAVAAQDGDADYVAGLVLVHDGADVLRIGDLLAVDGDDEVAAEHDGRVADVGLLIAAVQAGALGCSAGNDALDEDAGIGGEAHLRSEVGADGVGDDAERRAADPSVACEIGEDGFGGVDGNGEADAGALVGAVGGDHGVDADDFAVRVEQRTAGVAGVDGGIGLNGVFNGRAVFAADGADGADDAGGHGAAEAEGIADGVDLLADGEAGGVGERDGLEIGRVDLEESEVVDLVGSDDACLVAALVAELNFNAAIGSLDDVEVGEDVAGLVEDEA